MSVTSDLVQAKQFVEQVCDMALGLSPGHLKGAFCPGPETLSICHLHPTLGRRCQLQAYRSCQVQHVLQAASPSLACHSGGLRLLLGEQQCVRSQGALSGGVETLTKDTACYTSRWTSQPYRTGQQSAHASAGPYHPRDQRIMKTRGDSAVIAQWPGRPWWRRRPGHRR
jgi:hypothetical protein